MESYLCMFGLSQSRPKPIGFNRSHLTYKVHLDLLQETMHILTRRREHVPFWTQPYRNLNYFGRTYVNLLWTSWLERDGRKFSSFMCHNNYISYDIH